MDDRLTSLVKAIDKFVADHKDDRMAAYVVLLDENTEANQKKVADYAKDKEISVPLTLAVEGAKGPEAYKLNAEVPITVLVSKKNKIEANFALAAPAPDAEGQKKEAAEVLAAAEKLIAK